MTTSQSREFRELLKRTKELNFVLKTSILLAKFDMSIDLVSDKEEFKNNTFILDVGISKMQEMRRKIQLRENRSNIISRVDYFSTHTNPEYFEDRAPDDEFLRQLMQKYSEKRFRNEAHLHIYIDGYNDKWAFPLDHFGLSDSLKYLIHQIEQFCNFCNIERFKIEEVLY